MTEYKRSEDPGIAQHDVRAEEAAKEAEKAAAKEAKATDDDKPKAGKS